MQEPRGTGSVSIDLDYPPNPVPRFGYDRPPHPELQALIAAGSDRYAATLESFVPLIGDLLQVPLEASTPSDPSWHNGWYQGLDAASLYGLLVSTNPRRYVEVGSGNSTKFARRAITDHGLRTEVTSLDPEPRAEIDDLCDAIVRSPLESTDLDVVGDLEPGDVFFVDGSHRCFMNSDVSVVFTEVIPRLTPGVLIHVHDVFLPWDYPPQIAHWYFNEQYLLACWLLGGDRLEVVLPNFFISTEAALHRILDGLWQRFTWSNAPTNGVGFWMRRS